MNAETLKLIKAELKDDMKKRGFKTTGQWYMRFANTQVYQTINFQGSMSGTKFTVNIGLIPALRGNTDPKRGSFRLGPLTYGRDYWWGYSQESAMDFVAKIRETVLPMFDNCTTYRGMFDFVKDILLEDKYDREAKIKTPPIAVYNSTKDTTWAEILISLNELEYCKEMLYNRVKFCEEGLKRDLKKVAEKKTNSTAEGIQEYLAKQLDWYKSSYIAAIESGDLFEILAKIKENETKSVDALMKYVVTVK